MKKGIKATYITLHPQSVHCFMWLHLYHMFCMSSLFYCFCFYHTHFHFASCLSSQTFQRIKGFRHTTKYA